MIFLKRLKWPALIGVLVLMTCVACDEDPTTIGDGLIGNEPFISSKAEFDVFAFNRNIEAVQTNQLPIYQLGVYNDPIYGRTEAQVTTQLSLPTTNPTFGIYSQSIEDSPNADIPAQQFEVNGMGGEDEKVQEVYLFIPFLTQAETQRDTDNDGVDNVFDAEPEDSSNDSDGDGVSNATESANGTDPLDPSSFEVDAANPANTFANQVDLDSIYGNRAQEFNLKVGRSTFFLRDLDPSTSFQESQEFYSTQEFAPTFVSDILFDGPVTISDKEILIFFDEDDPDTDEDERLQLETRLSPGIRVKLDNDFFQQNFLDKEGQSELLSQTNFKEFMRGIHLSLEPAVGQDMMVLLDIAQGSINIVYDYNAVDTNNTLDDTSDDVINRVENEYAINLLQINSNAVNTLINEPYSGVLAGKLDTDINAERIFIKGGAGTYAEIRLFDEDGDGLSEKINEIKANNWVINEANLVFYVDRSTLDANAPTPLNEESSREPERLYLYKLESGEPLINFATEVSTAETLFGTYLNYDGLVDRDAGGKAEKYSIKITDHINNLVVRDSLNVNLGLTLTIDAGISGTLNAIVDGGVDKSLPVITGLSPVGTVLFGSEPDAQNPDKKLKLEIFYTESN